MRILRIRLANLNSLRGQHKVDFEAEGLRGAGLFAITGPTGAGKSTVLDAITLALYGKAARYGALPSPEDMMSRQCGDCMAEIVFEVPSGVFRAQWQLHRAHGQAGGKAQTAKRYIYDATGETLAQNIHEAEELIEKLVGLDYRRFLRSVLLAQGEFAQFLKARPDERAELLESLTGTSIYSELGKLAHTEAVRRESDLKEKESAVQHVPLLAEEQRQKLANDISGAEETFKQVKADLQQASVLLNKAGNLAGALEREQHALAGRQALAGERDQAAGDLQRLARHRLTAPFDGDLARLDAAEKAAANVGQSLRQAQADHSTAGLKARRCLLGYRGMVGDQIEARKNELKACQEKLGKAVERKAAAEKWLEAHKSDEKLANVLADLVSNLADLKAARRDLERGWQGVHKLARKLDPQEAAKLPESSEELTKARARKASADLIQMAQAKHHELTAACRQANDQLKSRENDLAKARLVAGFEEHRAGLKQGEACPLCGSLEHPFAEGTKPAFPFKTLEGLVEQASEACDVRKKELDGLERLRDDLKEGEAKLLGALDECSGVLKPLSVALATLAIDVPAPGKEDETKATLQRRATDYRKQADEMNGAEKERVGFEAERQRVEIELKTLTGRQSTLAGEPLPELPGADSALPASETQPRWASLAAADKAWGDAKTELASKNATLNNRQKDIQGAETELSKVRWDVAARLSQSPFAAIEDLKAARLEPAQAERLETIDTGLRERSNSLEADLKAARESIAKWRKEAAPEPEALAEVKTRHAALQLQHEQLIKDSTTWKNQLTNDEKNRLVVAEKQREIDACRRSLEVWRKLRGLIGSHDGRTFRRYAQGISLDVLVLRANRHLARLSDRYRMRRGAGEELDLEIEDLHQAGAVRPMASLSGGESFLASLALALGLSDIAGRNVRIESLFVDEGFGSLDSEALDVAISALETLRQDSKTVGVISHVDLLKERIAAQIIVEKQSGGTSVLRIG